jgi:murein DD-endopeptidase MepM/ murein hydrolase activator NlpD
MRTARSRRLAVPALLLCIAVLVGFGVLSQCPPCSGYTDPAASPYVLPYPVGASYALYQTNCTCGGHHGVYQYSYDFLIPIGDPVTAARAGVVVATLSGFADGNNGIENWVKVQHDDGTIAAYSHLHSVAVRQGDRVRAGDIVGLAGNSGQTGGVPHLHFQVAPCPEPRDCGTLPVTFRNARPADRVLKEKAGYAAQRYE